MKKKGFTLVELLVVIAIIALLMGILMPALTRVRQIAYRMMCASNLSGLGKAMMLYAGDNQEEFPRSGGSTAIWGTDGRLALANGPWLSTETAAFGESGSTEVSATIGSSFYLLVKYAEVTPKQFVCKGDAGAEAFSLDKWAGAATPAGCLTITDAWDFGLNPGGYCSYAYQIPFNISPIDAAKPARPVRTTSTSGTPVAADRNPYFDRNNTTHLSDTKLTAPTYDVPVRSGYKDPSGVLNSACHQWEGQNVLYVDGSARFEKTTNVGTNNDNIYQVWPNWPPDTRTPQQIEMPQPILTVSQEALMGGTISHDSSDAFLVNEFQSGNGGGTKP